MKKIGFLSRNINVNRLVQWVEIFETQYDVQAACGAIVNPWTHAILKRDFAGRFQDFHYLLDYLKQNWDSFDIRSANLRRLDELYGTSNLWLDLTSDRYLSSRPRPEALRMIVGHIRFWEDFYDRTQIEALVMDGCDMLAPLAALRVAQARGLACPILCYLPTVPAVINFMHTAYMRFEDITHLFEKLQSMELSAAQHQRAHAYVQTFREKQLRPDWFKDVWRPDLQPNVRWQNVRSFARRLPAYYLRGGKIDYTDQGPIRDARDRLLFVARRYGLRYQTNLFDQPEPGERYAYFPLQFQPEATTLVFAPFFDDQLYLVQQIARSLPTDMCLYVKEHPASWGRRPLSYYLKIKSLPNVRFMNSNMDSHALIRQADVVTTITGTAGWEGILYERPVIVFGNIYYDVFPLVKRVTDLTQLPDLLHTWLPAYQPDYECLLRFVTAVLEGSYPLEGGVEPDNPEVGDREMQTSVVKAIAQELGLTPRTSSQ